MAYFRIATSLTHNKKFLLFGDGTVRRDFTFIEDIVTAICKIRDFRSLGNGERHEIYNVGGGSPHSILEMIEKFESLTHLKLNLEVAPPVLADVQMTLADTTKLQADTGFIPQITLDDGISKFLSWSQSPGINSRLLEWVSS
jgi:UDP-glucuronate 4-epimerase